MNIKPQNLIVEIKFGSHLYGTATESSDLDFKGIFVPTMHDILLGRIPKTADSSPNDDSRKNLPGELDCQYYSLHHFLRLATQGQTVAIDMLFAPENCVRKSETYGWIWDRIVAERQKFLSKQMQAFVGYARGQAAKYSLKGKRLDSLRGFEQVLSVGEGYLSYSAEDRLMSEKWDNLPRDDERVNPHGIRELQIAGKWYGETTPIEHVLSSVRNSLSRYGKRAHAASEAGGVDWKALSHAVRVSRELIQLLVRGEVTFPLDCREFLLNIKKGEVPIETVQRVLNEDLAAVERLTEKSSLPEKVDYKYWDQFLMDTIMEYFSNEMVKVRILEK